MLYGLAKKMERLLDDAKHIKKLLPWLETDNIINFIRKIPLEKNYMRIQITLRHFLNTRDLCSNDFTQEIEDDARDIVVAMPDTSYNRIKEELLILGNIPNRKEVVLRQLLHRKQELNEILKEINVSSVKKRRPESPDDIFEPNPKNNQTNINIKIRKVDGTLEVVSTISNQENPSTSKVSSDSDEHSDEPTTSASGASSINQFPTSSSDSPLSPISSIEADDPCPELTTVLNNLIKSRSQSTSSSDTVMPKRSSKVPSLNKIKGNPNTSKADRKKEVVQVSSDTEDENPKPEKPIVSSNTNADNEPGFNLVDFVKELSAASEYKIVKLCKQMGLNLTERPKEEKLNLLLNRLFDDVVEVESAGSSDSTSDTQEYDYTYLSKIFPTAPPKNKNGIVEAPGETQLAIPVKQQFQLRPATFIGTPVLTPQHVLLPDQIPQPNIISAHAPQPNIISAQAPQPNIISAQEPQPNIISAQAPQRNITSAQAPQPNFEAAQQMQPNFGAVQPPQPNFGAVQPPRPNFGAVQPPQPNFGAVQPPQPNFGAVQPPQPNFRAVQPPQPNIRNAHPPQLNFGVIRLLTEPNLRTIREPQPNIRTIREPQPNLVPVQPPQHNYLRFPVPDDLFVLDNDPPDPADIVERRFRHQIDHPTPRVHPINAQPNIFMPRSRFGSKRNIEPTPAEFEPLPSTSGATPTNADIDEDSENPDEALNLSMDSDSEAHAMQVDEEPVAGPSNVDKKKERVLDQNLVFRMIEMFPEACPEYIRDVCDGRVWDELDDVVTIILAADDYPRRPLRLPSPAKEVDAEEQYEILKELLPDADPTYLRIQCEKFAHDDKGLKEFINHAMETKSYPTLKDYQRKQQLSAQQKQYTTEFNIENFIQLFPDPEKTFNDPKRTVKMDTYSVHYLTMYFKNRYDKIAIRYIQQVVHDYNYKVKLCDQALERMIKKNEVMKCRRKLSPLPDNLQNIPLLQELAYLTHKEDIKNYILEKKKKEEQERIEAKENGLMETCQCCYDDEVMPKDTFSCPSECKFCRDCIKKSCEVAMGEGKTDFPCLAACPNEFSLQILQEALPPKMFSKLAQKKALAEIKAAGIEELETCPFCDFASIPNEADKIFRCLNPDCMQESCRKCKEPNHVPLKCEEVEKDQDVKARTYIENKMTEALLRKCWKCGTSFFKEEGCNKMTCSCGAHMCYICQKPVKDYSHFNGIGGDKYHLCPLYSDTNKVNQQNVLGAAAAAKAEIDPSKLKVDPTVGITDHFKNRARKLPREPHLEVIHRINRPGFNLHHHHGPHRHRHQNRVQNVVPGQVFPANLDLENLMRVPFDVREEIPGIFPGNVDLENLMRVPLDAIEEIPRIFPENVNLENLMRVPLDAREEIRGVRIERNGAVHREEQQRLIRRRVEQHFTYLLRLQEFANNRNNNPH